MKRNVVIFFFTVPMMTGVAQGSSTDASQTLIANPAAVFCEDQGGSYHIVDEESGARGICILPDGEKVDAWEFFRAQNDPAKQD